MTTLSIGQLAQRSGVAPSALRFYEDSGLIASQRSSSGHRRYARGILRRVAFIVFAQRIGLTLSEIRAELAKLPSEHTPNGAEWSRLSSGWRKRIEARIAELQRLRVGLTECIGCGCLSLSRCHIANAGDRMARRGAGPRIWIDDARPRQRKRC